MRGNMSLRVVLVLSVAMAALVLTALPAGAASITILNPGFEVRGTYDLFLDGVDKYNQPGQETWRHWQRADNGGPLRIWNPGAPGCALQGAVDVGFAGNAAEGTYVVLVRSRESDGANTDGVNYFEAAAQLLTTTFDPYAAYTMTVAVGNPPGSDYYYPNWFGYAVQLAVGGTNIPHTGQYSAEVSGGTIVSQDASNFAVPIDTYVTSTVTFHPDPTDPAILALAGQPLQIRLCALEDQTNLARTGFAVFDDVKLESVSALYWDLDGGTAGAGGATPAGTWNAVDPNWNTDHTGGSGGSVSVWSASSLACFSAGTDANGTYMITVDGTQDIRGLNFQNGTVTLANGAAGVLRMTLDCGVEVAAGLTARIETPISDDGTPRRLIKKGDGTLVLSGANTYTGGTAVLEGTLRLGADDVLPDGIVTVSGGAPGVTATLDLDGHDETIGSLTLGGASPTSAALITTGAGTLTLGGDVTYDRSANPLGAKISGKLALGGPRTFTVNNSAYAADDLTVSADISGAACGLIKEGEGMLVLSGNNVAATGGTTINAGPVQFNSTASINGTLRDVTVNFGAAVVFGSSFGAANIPAALSTRIVADSAGVIAADNYAATNFDFDAPRLTAAYFGAVGNVTYTGTLTPQGTTYRLGGGGATLTMANTNAVTGTGNSLIVGGNVVLSGANNYDRGTTLVAGTLGIGSDNSIGSGTLTFNGGGISSDSVTARTIANAVAFTGNGRLGDAVNNGKLTFTNTVDLGAAAPTLTVNSDAEFSGVVSDSGGGLTKAGGGTLILSNNNNYTGGTTVSGGTLVLSGSNSTSGVTLNAATLIIGNNGSLGGGTFTIGGAGTVRAAGTVVTTNAVATNSNFTIAGTDALTLGGTMTLSASRTITNNNITSATTFGAISGGGGSYTLTFSGDGSTAVTGIIDTGSGSLTKNGTGTLTLSNDASTYTGVTSIAAGTLSVSTLSSGGQPSSIGASANADTNLVLANGTTLKYTGAGDITNRQFRFNGSLAGLSITLDASGSGPINFTSPTGPSHSSGAQTRTLNLIGSNTGENTLAANIGNNGSGALSVVKDGAGTWVLSGASTYTGGTTVNDGTLLVNNATGSGTGTGTVMVNANGALGGIGVIGGAVTVNGALAPGAGAGTLTVNNNLTMETGSTYVWQVGSDDHAGAVDINGTLSIVSSWSLALANNGGTLGTGEYNLFTYDTFSDVFTLPTIYYGNTGWSNATVALDETGRRIYLKFGRPGDTNEDGAVDAADFITLKKNFGKSVGGAEAAVGDFDKSGNVNWADLGILMSNMGTGGGAPATAPEPCSAMLLVFGAAALLRRKRKA